MEPGDLLPCLYKLLTNGPYSDTHEPGGLLPYLYELLTNGPYSDTHEPPSRLQMLCIYHTF
jgi:hypothetical protein